jgi:CDGSH-type Zn-finger protein
VNVTVIEDGPLKVSNARSLRYAGKDLDVDGDVFLCRCGQSSNAPFCDGTHRKVGFSGANEARADKEIRVWEGQTIRTFFNPNTCMHVFKCKPLKALREAELAGDTAAAEEIMRTVATCPSGALTYEVKGGVTAPAEPDLGPDIDVIEGGEVRIQTAFEIDVPKLERQRDARATLCRCGLSKNKPWCDGRHKQRKGFR